MKSTYPSSKSIFDNTSDVSGAGDVGKCRSTASFSSLADLFTNRSCKSDLFPKVRASAFVPEEVRFPAKKKRECEERTSIWHEWGSGECQSEHIAQESSGFSSDNLGGKFSVPSSSTFRNLGSANTSLVNEGFTFPARKNREEGSSWREERTSRQDWSTTAVPKGSKLTETSPIVGAITGMNLSKPCAKPSDFFASSKSSLFFSMGAPARSASEEVSFPARKKREERIFWQESVLDGTPSDYEVTTTRRDSPSGAGSFADMYLKKAGSICSNLFSNGAVGSADDVIFPKRKDRADRNAWRDWTNTGYGNWEYEGDGGDYWVDKLSCSNSAVPTEGDDLFDLPPATGTPSIQGANRVSERLCESENLPASECVLRSPVLETGSDVVDSMQTPSQARELHAWKSVSGLSDIVVGNVDVSGCPEPCLESQPDRCSESTTSKGATTVDVGEACEAMEDTPTEVDDVQELRFSDSRSEQRNDRNTLKCPPPLRSLSRHASSRVPNHMPWVQLEHIRSEGRIVLQEVKTTQPVVFQPIRKEGRLVLELIGQEDKKNGDAGLTCGRNSLVADERAILVFEEEMDSNDSVAMKTHVKVEAEQIRATQRGESALAKTETRTKSSKVWPLFGAVADEARMEKTSKVWPIICMPRELFPRAEITFARTEEAVAGLRDRKFNSRQTCYMVEECMQSPDRRVPGREKSAPTVKDALIQERSPPWLLSKVSLEDRRFDGRKTLHSASIRNAAERLGQTGNIITIHRTSEIAPRRAHFQSSPRSSTLRNGLSGLNCSRAEGEGSLTRSRSIRSRVEGEGSLTRGRSMRNLSLSDGGTLDSRKDELRGRAAEATISICQGIIRDSVLSLASTQFLKWSLRSRPDIPSEPDPRLTNYKPTFAAAFSCADGMGKRHHEKNFWEQQACVSITT